MGRRLMDDDDIFEVILDNELHLESMARQEDTEIRQYCKGVRQREQDTEFMNGELDRIDKAWEQVESAMVISGLFDIDSEGGFTVHNSFKTPAARSVLSRLSRPLSLSKRILHFLTAERV
jgi:hypothetical protein